MNYRVCTSNSPTELANHVKQLYSEGWRPQGGISMVVTRTNVHTGGYYEEAERLLWAQAMMKEEVND